MINLDDYEKEVLRFLGKRFDSGEKYVSERDFPRYDEVGKDRIEKIIKRFVNTLEWLQRDTGGDRTMWDPPRWEISGQVLEFVNQLDHPPPKDCPKQVDTLLRSKWWLAPFFYLLRWVGILK